MEQGYLLIALKKIAQGNIVETNLAKYKLIKVVAC